MAKGRLQPGKIFLVDVEGGRIVDDGTMKGEIAARQPYGRWYAEHTVHLDDLPDGGPRRRPATPCSPASSSSATRRRTCASRSRHGRRGRGADGLDGQRHALAVLSDRAALLYTYFKQLFAQVTNPPIDPIREKIVMALRPRVGRRAQPARRDSRARSPADHLAAAAHHRRAGEAPPGDHTCSARDTLDATWPVSEGAGGLQRALDRLCREASAAIDAGDNILILVRPRRGAERAPLPALLAVGAVHHHLVREGTRLQAGLVVESGEPREVHHIACLLGYGASAVCPYLAFETLFDMFDRGVLPGVNGADEAERNMIKAVGKGLLKTISKMGISTVRSYSGAQIFEAVGLEPGLVERYFTGTTSRIGGIGLDVLAQETLTRHARAYPRGRGPPRRSDCPGGGVHAWRRAASVASGTRTRSRACRTPCATAAASPTSASPQRCNGQSRRRAHVARPAEAAHAGGSRFRSTRWSRRRRS